MKKEISSIHDVENLGNLIIKNTRYNLSDKIIWILFFSAIWFCFLGIFAILHLIEFFKIGWCITIESCGWISSSSSIIILMFLWGFIWLWIMYALFKWIEKLIIIPILDKIRNTVKGILTSHVILSSEIKNVDNLDTILEKIIDIYSLQKVIINLDTFIFFITPARRADFKKIIQISNKTCYKIIIDLRSDLLTRIEEQKQTLSGAKADVEEHISGTTALEQVSEAQKLRLDEQIRQF